MEKSRSKMKISDRAKIFMPFDAVKGFKEALREKEKIIVKKKVLSSSVKEEIMNNLKECKKGMMIEVTYYSIEDNDYLKIKGILNKIDEYEKEITIVKTIIKMNDIYDIKLDEEEVLY